MKSFLLITVLTLSACGAHSGAWVRPAGTPDTQVRRDLYECERDAAQAQNSAWIGAAGQIQAHMRARELGNRCMVAKGYRWDKAITARIR